MFAAFQEALDTALSDSMKISCSFPFSPFPKALCFIALFCLENNESLYAIRLSLADNAAEIAEY